MIHVVFVVDAGVDLDEAFHSKELDARPMVGDYVVSGKSWPNGYRLCLQVKSVTWYPAYMQVNLDWPDDDTAYQYMLNITKR
jgi:hypothetical protein